MARVRHRIFIALAGAVFAWFPGCASPSGGRSDGEGIRLQPPVSAMAVQPDGVLSAGEWERAMRVPLRRGQAWILSDGRQLAVGVQMGAPAIATLLIAVGDRAWALHASAALGTGEYRRMADGRWSRVRDFDYRCRDPQDSACRASFLASEGWLGNVDPHGTQVREFVLLPSRFGGPGQQLRLAVTSLILPAEAQVWPETADAAGSLQLQQGFLPETLDLKPERWASLPPGASPPH